MRKLKNKKRGKWSIYKSYEQLKVRKQRDREWNEAFRISIADTELHEKQKKENSGQSVKDNISAE